MGLYEVILAPAVLVTDSTARIYQDVGDLLELTEDEAAGFNPPEAVRQIGTEDRADESTDPVVVPSGTPVTFVDPPTAPAPDDTSTETGDEPAASVETPPSDPAPEKTERRGRQGRSAADGQD